MKRTTIEINDGNYAQTSLNQWQNYFESIYEERNRKIKNVEVIWFRVLENASKVAEDLRRYKYGNAMENLSHMFCWLCGFCSRTKRNLGETVWKKYPYVCPYCREDRDKVVKSCNCPGHRMETEETPTHRKEKMINEEILDYFRKTFKKKKPRSLDGWVSMFDKLYKNSNYSASIEHIGFHLMEEIGEVSRAWRRKQEFEKRKEKNSDIKKARAQLELDLDYEIADVFSWMCALINKISSIADAVENLGKSTIEIRMAHRKTAHMPIPKVALSNFVFAEYGRGCPNCGRKKCLEDCFLTECKFMTEKKKCGYEWKEQRVCDYGKTLEESYVCGKVFRGKV
jgi:NTP pyrophosphatase (non-canonical NTP hydrolase)